MIITPMNSVPAMPLDGAKPTRQKTRRFKSLGKEMYHRRFVYLLLLPGVIYFLVFHLFPFWFLTAAFREYSIFTGLGEWIGLEHFSRLFQSALFGRALRNTLIISFMIRILGFPLPVILAVVLSELRWKPLRKMTQTVVYLPHFLSWVIIAGLMTTILSPSSGIVNIALQQFGVEPVFFMADDGWFRWVLFFANRWKETGWGTIIFLAAITSIDPNLYEAAIIDGANRVQRIVHVTLPGMAAAAVAVFILGLANVLLVFEQVLVMYNPLVANVSETIGTLVYKMGLIQGDVSFATAVGLFQSLVGLALVLFTNRMVKTVRGQGIF